MFDECCNEGDLEAAAKCAEKLWKAYRRAGQVMEAMDVKNTLNRLRNGKGKAVTPQLEG